MDKPNQPTQRATNPQIAALMQSANQQLRFPASSSTPQNPTQYTQQFQSDFIASHFAQLSQQQYPTQTDAALHVNQNYAISHDMQDESQNPPKEIKEQEMFLPKENIRKVMKKVLPTYAKISKEAVDCIQECATEFILFALGEASDIAQTQKRKIVCGSHIVEAFHTLGLDFYSQLMNTYLQQLKASQVTSTKTKKRKRNKDASESDEVQDENSTGNEDLYHEQELSSNVAQEVLSNSQYSPIMPTANTISNNNNNNNNSTISTNNNNNTRSSLPSLEQLQELYRQLYPNAPAPSYQPGSQPSNQNQSSMMQNSNAPQQQSSGTTYQLQPGTYSQQPGTAYPQQTTGSYPQQQATYLVPNTKYTQPPPSGTFTPQPNTFQQQPPSSYPQQGSNYTQQPPNTAQPTRPAIPMERMMSFIQQMANAQLNANPNSTQQQQQQPPNKRNG